MRFIDINNLISKKSSRWESKDDLWLNNPKLKKDYRGFSHDKCWYCESKLAGSDMAIDHFRPKGAVQKYLDYNYNEPLKDDGYYWLKDDPANYRGSCTYSNSRREGGGKGAYFPLADTSGYMPENGTDTTVEAPLLLDPCNKSDVNLLTFLGGSPCCSSSDPNDEKRVKVSTELYNLDNGWIRAERMRVWENVADTIDDFEAGQMSEKRCVKELKKYISHDSAYSAAAIAYINSWNNDTIKSKLDLEL